MFPEYVLVVIGILLIVFSFWIDANSNFLSKLVFKISPLVMGIYITVYALVTFGYLTTGG